MKAAFSVAVGLLLWPGTWAEAKGRRYVLRDRVVQAVGASGTSYEHDLSLQDTARRRVLWKMRVPDVGKPFWSQDGRALAVDCGLGGSPRRLVWRAGFRLRNFDLERVDSYIMSCAWAPGNRRLLIFSGSGGSEMFNNGQLSCLELSRWPRYKYFDAPSGQVRRYAWRGRKTVIYWKPHARNIDVKPKPRFWRLP